MAGYWKTLAKAVGGGLLGTEPKDPLLATIEALKKAEAFVDPSRVMAGSGILPYNPSVLVSRKGLAVFDSMKRDEQVKACLAFKKASMLASSWEVVSPGDQEADWEVTRFVRDTFDQFPGGWHKALKKVLLAIDYGYSVTEKVYGDVVWAPGKVVLLKMNSAKPHYFDLVSSATGELLELLQRYVPGQQSERHFPPDKFVLYVHDKEFENHYGRSELESAYRPWWVKENAYKWFAVYLERYGMSPLFALYDANVYQAAELTELKKVVKNMQNATMGIIPRGDKKESLEFWSQEISAQSKEVFLAAFERFDADIGRAILVPSLIGATSEDSSAGGGQRGSYARAQMHFDLFMTVVGEQQGLLCSDAVNSQIIPQLCDLNFPGLKSYPQMRMLPFDDDKKLDLYKMWTELVAGKVVNQIEDDEVHIRKALGFPENEDPSLPEPAPVVGATGDQEPDPNDPNKPEEVPEGEQTPQMHAFAEEHDAVWLRIGDETVAVRRS
ncbi:MAG: DUF935 family protein [Candidatus Binatia bacterium]|nr:DUF935 family protein [Candidatus Binatia bacterium]